MLKQSIQAKGVFLLILVFCLMFLQWTLEAKKWQLLLKPIAPISMRTALSAIFRGISFSIATPNRMGEFAGRILFLPNGKRLAGTSLTFIGNFAQLIVTLLFASASLFVIEPFFVATNSSTILSKLTFLFQCTIPLLTLTCLVIYFKLGSVFEYLFSFSFMQKVKSSLLLLEQLPVHILLRVLFLSILRFCIFIFQYFLLFQLTKVSVSLFDTTVTISVMFLWLAILPTIAFLELGVRWQFALILLGGLSSNRLGISIAVTAIWFINLIVPSLLGVFSVFRVNRESPSLSDQKL